MTAGGFASVERPLADGIDNDSHCDILRVMYICVCNAITVDTVRDLAAEGLSFEEIQALTNCSGSCGSCLEFAESVVDQSRRSSGPTLPISLATT